MAPSPPLTSRPCSSTIPRGAAWHDLPTAVNEETAAAALDHVPGVTLDRDAEYITLPPWRAPRPATALHDDDRDGT